MWSGPRTFRLASVVAVTIPACLLLASPSASAAYGARHPGQLTVVPAAARAAPLVTDIRPKARAKRGLAAPVMSPAMARANDGKQAELRSTLLVLAGRDGRESKCAIAACLAGLPAARDLAATQQPQLRDYFCGPATVAEMLAQVGVRISQWTAARELGTTPGGTNWSDGSGYPVPRVLNANQARNRYVAVALPWSPTGGQIRTYEFDLVTDINKNGGVPLAGNAYEAAGGPHLVGNPVNQTIMHWIDIRGYRDNGTVTDYEDSVHSATSIGWSLNVPGYSSLASSTMVYILGARGYDW